jgi:tyrosine-protein kinase Etk/Wzc
MTHEKKQREEKRSAFLTHDLSLLDYWLVFVEARWIIVLTVMFTVCLGFLYLYVTKPIYEVDSVLQMEEKNNLLGNMDKLTELLGGDSSKLNGEIELLRSRTILSGVIKELKLDIMVQPNGWALFERFKQRILEHEPQFDVKKLDVPLFLEGEWLILRMTSGQEYVLSDSQEHELLRGQLGQEVNHDNISMLIEGHNIIEGDAVKINKLAMIDAIETLSKSLKVFEKAKDSSLIRIVCQHTNPQLGMKIINAITHAYVLQNIQRHSEEAHKSILFLKEQLPKVKDELKIAEGKLKKFREENQSLNLENESKALLEQLVTVQQQISETEVQRSGLARKYTSNHPLIKVLDAKVSQLNTESSKLEARMKKRPKTEQEVIGLMRDERVKSDVYTYLLNKLQELNVMQAGTVGNVRIIDEAMKPSKPVKPKKSAIILGAALAGLFFGLLFAFARYTLRNIADDPEKIEAQLGVTVSASIPHSPNQKKLDKEKRRWRRKRDASDGQQHFVVSAKKLKKDPSFEAFLSLRTSLHFLLMKSSNNIIMLSGPRASLGKSFVSVNMSALMANKGSRILLIDADLRRGHLHEYFSFSQRSPGLTEAIMSPTSWKDCVRPSGIEGLDVMTTGALPQNAANTLMHEGLGSLLDLVSFEYDYVWIDTPPVLVATDAALLAQYAGTFLLLLRFGVVPMAEVKESIRRLGQSSIHVDSIIINDVNIHRTRYGYYYYGKQYDY